MKKRKFMRTDSTRHSKLGKKRKKLQRWRKPRGRHNKIREKRFSYPIMPVIGMRKPKSESGKIKGKEVVVIRNLLEAREASKDKSVIIGKIGAKKKIEIMKILNDKKVEIINLGRKRK